MVYLMTATGMTIINIRHMFHPWDNMHQMASKQYWTLQGQRYILPVPPSPNFMTNHFACSLSWDKCTRIPQNDLERYHIRGTHVCVSSVPRLNFTASHYIQPFQVAGYFEISALNDPKMTLNTTRPKVPHTLPVFVSQKFQFVFLHDQLCPIFASFRSMANHFCFPTHSVSPIAPPPPMLMLIFSIGIKGKTTKWHRNFNLQNFKN